MIPDLVKVHKSPFLVLPPGIHTATVSEVEARFATTPHRQKLMDGFMRAYTNFRNAGCRHIYLDGSFTTDKLHPNDFDGCYDPAHMNFDLVDQVLLDFTYPRLAQKQKYFGEMFPTWGSAGPSGRTFLDHFQIDKQSGLPKGILLVVQDSR